MILAEGFWAAGAVPGSVGAALSTLLGFRARTALLRWLTLDLMAAMIEDIAAILISLLTGVIVF